MIKVPIYGKAESKHTCKSFHDLATSLDSKVSVSLTVDRHYYEKSIGCCIACRSGVTNKLTHGNTHKSPYSDESSVMRERERERERERMN